MADGPFPMRQRGGPAPSRTVRSLCDSDVARPHHGRSVPHATATWPRPQDGLLVLGVRKEDTTPLP